MERTNQLGQISVKVNILHGNPGKYIFSFFIGGIYTRAITAITNFPVDHIDIIKQPKSYYDMEIGHRVGDYLEGAELAVFDKDNVKLTGYTIIASLDMESENYTNTMIDYVP